MSRKLIGILLCLLGLGIYPACAEALGPFEGYDIESASVSLSRTGAGAHADFTTSFELSENEGHPYALTRDVVVELPPGLFGNPEAFPKCTTQQLGATAPESECPQDSQVGSTDITVLEPTRTFENEPIYNMPAPGGDVLARFGFFAGLYPMFLNIRLDPETLGLIASVEGASSAALFISARTTFWGVPASPTHDAERLTPLEARDNTGPSGGRPSTMPETPFMTNPTSCGEMRTVTLTVRSYQLPDQAKSVTVPFPQITGCGSLEFNPRVTLKPTTSQATTGTGLDYDLGLPTKGLEFGNLSYGSELKRAEVVLPEGMTINPAAAEGLGVCAEMELARETYNSPPSVGCPESSKIGTVTADAPVIDRGAEGSLFLAKPYENPFDSLLAVYLVLKIPSRGVLVKVPGEVRLDPASGQITTIFDQIPQLPVANFHLHFREGGRAPLVTPPACGSYVGVSKLSPWSAPEKVNAAPSGFGIESGPNHGPCPAGGLPPFHPELAAGSENPGAGQFSPFVLELARSDSEQEITHFSIKLPPGLVAKLAGVPFCSDASIALAKSRSGIHGGDEELTAPSCPAASRIGTSWAGAGVGDVLTYVPGKIYLAGPYHGSPLSIVVVTAAKAGPFDLGTVVVREALRIDPVTAAVFVDPSGSDPIPHIIRGVPLHLRNIRVYADRRGFMINPTDCTRTSTASTVLGSGLDPTSESDDNPFTISSPFQVADCAALGFKPKFTLSFKGGTRRSRLPALRAVLTMPKGGANVEAAEVLLPRSEFLEQGNIRTICTRAQFDAGAGRGAQCPAGAIYGHARAVTPLLDEPLKGPVFLRSNGGERDLPDLVAALHGERIDIDLVGFIDSVGEKNKRGERVSRIRSRFMRIPDAPVTKFVLQMQGGKKGLLVNSTDLCLGSPRAEAFFSAQNGRERNLRPIVKTACKKSKMSAK
jgi:hypothetical protein